MKLLFATNNSHKIREIADLLDESYTILGLSDLNISEEIPEEGDTLEENALSKARYLYQKSGMNVFADDTGLEVKALGGAPGVHSARYAGEAKNPHDNMVRLLDEMKDLDDREARFRTVIALIFNGTEYLFEGSVEGEITREIKGRGGFGYDPVFVARGHSHTFAEIPLSEKNLISHRARAMRKLLEFLSRERPEKEKE